MCLFLFKYIIFYGIKNYKILTNIMVKFSIVMGLYNRKNLTINTLDTLEKLYSNRNDWEVVMVDDCSREEWVG